MPIGIVGRAGFAGDKITDSEQELSECLRIGLATTFAKSGCDAHPRRIKNRGQPRPWNVGIGKMPYEGEPEVAKRGFNPINVTGDLGVRRAIK